MCVCFLFACALLCKTVCLFPIILCKPTEPCRAEEEIKSNQYKYVSSVCAHFGLTHTHTDTLCVNLASSGLLSLEADCQHQCVRGESYLGLTSATPIPRMRTVVFACVCVYRTGGLHSCSSDWPADALRRPPISFFCPRMESALRCDGMMLLSLLLFPLRGEPSTK